MGVIVAKLDRMDSSDSEFPVVGVSPGVSDGYVLEHTYRYVDGEGDPSYSGEYHRPDPDDIIIGGCKFEKDGGGLWWYLVDSGHRCPVVYGQETLEAYVSGKMFEHYFQMFGGPD